MPRGFVDDPEGDVADEEVNDGGFGDDILTADADGIDGIKFVQEIGIIESIIHLHHSFLFLTSFLFGIYDASASHSI